MRDLAAMGFGAVGDCTVDSLNQRYFAGRTDGQRVGGIARLLVARV